MEFFDKLLQDFEDEINKEPSTTYQSVAKGKYSS